MLVFKVPLDFSSVFLHACGRKPKKWPVLAQGTITEPFPTQKKTCSPNTIMERKEGRRLGEKLWAADCSEMQAQLYSASRDHWFLRIFIAASPCFEGGLQDELRFPTDSGRALAALR